MKTKKEIIGELLERSAESLIKIELQMGYVQNRHAIEGKQQFLNELAELTANKKETQQWIEYLTKQAAS